MPKLLIITSAPAMDLPGGRLRLDVKAVDGMRLHRDLWDGQVDAVMWRGSSTIPFGADYTPDELGFALTVLDAGAVMPGAMLAGYDVVAASGDLHNLLDLPAYCGGSGQPKLVYSIEYTQETRLQIIRLDRGRSMLRKLRSAVWTRQQERRRRAAFRAASGIQANGFPAYAAYKALNPQTMIYLDSRIATAMMATQELMAARASHLRAGGPLRLVHSGRLETMKGAQDLIPVATALRKAGVSFTLDIYGTGGMEADIRAAITAARLGDTVQLHAPVDFETGLVPILRSKADLFLSCHRQADPSCTYLESMGCGLPVAGYRNAMWAALHADSGAGWVVPLGDVNALATQIAALARSPDTVVQHAAQALTYAQRHDVRTEFAKRMDHLAMVART